MVLHACSDSPYSFDWEFGATSTNLGRYYYPGLPFKCYVDFEWSGVQNKDLGYFGSFTLLKYRNREDWLIWRVSYLGWKWSRSRSYDYVVLKRGSLMLVKLQEVRKSFSRSKSSTTPYKKQYIHRPSGKYERWFRVSVLWLGQFGRRRKCQRDTWEGKFKAVLFKLADPKGTQLPELDTKYSKP